MASQVGYYFKSCASLNGLPAPYFPSGAPSGTATAAQPAYRMFGKQDLTMLGTRIYLYLTTGTYTAQRIAGQQKITDLSSILLPNMNGYTQGRLVSLNSVSGNPPSVVYNQIIYRAVGGPIGPARGIFLVGAMDVTYEPRDGQDISAIYWWFDFGQSVTIADGDRLEFQPRLQIVSA